MKTSGKSTFKVAALAVLGLSTVLGTGISAQAAPGANGGGQGEGRGGRKGGRGGMNLQRMAQKLNLTAAQQSQLQTIFEGSRAQSQEIRNDSSLTDAQKKERLKALHASARRAVMNVLTPAQQAQLRQMMAQRRKGGQHLAKNLNLSDTQKAQLKDIRQRAKADMMAVRNDTSLTQAQKRTSLQAIRAQMREAINQILTPEQQAQMEQTRAQRQGQRQGQRANGAQRNAARHSGGLNG